MTPKFLAVVTGETASGTGASRLRTLEELTGLRSLTAFLYRNQEILNYKLRPRGEALGLSVFTGASVGGTDDKTWRFRKETVSSASKEQRSH
nr:hypothetical protein HmN_000990400 [Hymenolepis microstoma]